MSDNQNPKALKLLDSFRQSENDKFDEFWARLCAAWPRHELSVATTAVYYDRLRRFKAEDLRRASEVLIDNCEYFPSVAEIIETIQRLPRPKQKLLDISSPLTEEQRRQNSAELQKIVSDLSAKKTAQPKQTEEERRAEIKAQAARLRHGN